MKNFKNDFESFYKKVEGLFDEGWDPGFRDLVLFCFNSGYTAAAEKSDSESSSEEQYENGYAEGYSAGLEDGYKEVFFTENADSEESFEDDEIDCHCEKCKKNAYVGEMRFVCVNEPLLAVLESLFDDMQTED